MTKTWMTIKEIVPKSRNNTSNKVFGADVDKANEYNFCFVNIGKNTYKRTQNVLHGVNVSNYRHDNVLHGSDNTFRPQAVDTETVILTIKK